MDKIKTLLVAVRILDKHDGTVSITSLLLSALGAGVVAAPSWPGVAALAVAVVLYGHKRVTNRATAVNDPVLRELAENVAAATTKLQALEGGHAELREKVIVLNNRTAPRR